MKLLVISILLISILVSCARAQTSTSTPGTEVYEALHNIPIESLGDASRYWNVEWAGYAPQLYDEIAAVNTMYHYTHEYVLGETDCNDMAAEMWEMLTGEGIISLIVVGNVEKSRESFMECNHAWLIVYNGEGAAAALEVTSGKTYTWEDTRAKRRLGQYWEGFIYEKPSDLSADFVERW